MSEPASFRREPHQRALALRVRLKRQVISRQWATYGSWGWMGRKVCLCGGGGGGGVGGGGGGGCLGVGALFVRMGSGRVVGFV